MGKSSTFIPEKPEELSSGWLSEVLSEKLGYARVQSVRQTTLGDGEGFVGDIIRLDLAFTAHAPDCPSSVVAKLPKLANRAMGELIGAYERENMFYMTYAADLPVATPELYYGEFDRDRGSEKQEEIIRQAEKIPRFLQGLTNKLAWWIASSKKRRYILLMEDISSATPIDQLQGVDSDTMKKIVADVAKLHAHFWERADLQEQFWLLPMDIDAKMREETMHRSRETFSDVFAESVAAGLDPYLDEVSEYGVVLCHQLAKGPTTLAHCDLRLDNLFFRDDQVLFIDWQLVRRGNPAYDLAYLLSSGLVGEDSALPILATYHQALEHAGVSSWSLESLCRDYQTALKVVLLNLSSVDQVELGEGRGKQLMRAWIDRLRVRLQVDCPIEN